MKHGCAHEVVQGRGVFLYAHSMHSCSLLSVTFVNLEILLGVSKTSALVAKGHADLESHLQVMMEVHEICLGVCGCVCVCVCGLTLGM